MSRAERLLLAQLKAGRTWTGDLKVSFYKPLGLSATHLDMAYRQLMAKLSSVAELAKDNLKDAVAKIASKKVDIKRKEKAREKARKNLIKLNGELRSLMEKATERRKLLINASARYRDDCLFALKVRLEELHAKRAAVATARTEIRDLSFALHQHKRRLAILERRAERTKKHIDDPTLCFGSKKLFRAQFNLTGNGYDSHAAWLGDWRSHRSAQFTLDGNSSKEGGNQFARLRKRADGRYDLELRLPTALAHLATRIEKHAGSLIPCVDLRGLSFNHGNDVIDDAIVRGQPVTVKFLRDDKSWKVLVSVDHKQASKTPDFAGGALGVDLNAGHVSAALVDASGNPIAVYNFPCVTYGKSSAKAQDAIRKVAAEIAVLAKQFDVPVVAEFLDFSEKKRALKDAKNARYARMLSSFAYSAFGTALSSACLRQGVALRRVNPAYTSIIGRVKFARRYGLSVHEAASATIARRAMGYSEKLPRSSTGTVKVPTNGSDHVTLDLPVRKDASEQAPKSRHVWSEWNRLNKEYHQKALAALGSSRRKLRPKRGSPQTTGRSTLPGGSGRNLVGGAENRSMVSRNTRDVPADSRFSHAARGGGVPGINS
ncbi:IS200/IS605 family accessory protein TnpB-related protein [Rhizobium sp. 2MFCol3.1]|uniref:IS200/IS605 family accessory protein TnpB-related protein n=1 Tax=Rhizobium sp. 2MFCol3.1 TaxID=1246459 RepID=UPI0009DAF936|nr:IS200/IS605 family accessory protein TnpB-related protein [Rhizobium sp. 2MFCol3.1]